MRVLQRTSSGMWEADRLLQEEEEEYLDVSGPSPRAEPPQRSCITASRTVLLEPLARDLTRARAAGDGVFQSEKVGEGVWPWKRGEAMATGAAGRPWRPVLSLLKSQRNLYCT